MKCKKCDKEFHYKKSVFTHPKLFLCKSCTQKHRNAQPLRGVTRKVWKVKS